MRLPAGDGRQPGAAAELQHALVLHAIGGPEPPHLREAHEEEGRARVRELPVRGAPVDLGPRGMAEDDEAPEELLVLGRDDGATSLAEAPGLRVVEAHGFVRAVGVGAERHGGVHEEDLVVLLRVRAVGAERLVLAEDVGDDEAVDGVRVDAVEVEHGALVAVDGDRASQRTVDGRVVAEGADGPSEVTPEPCRVHLRQRVQREGRVRAADDAKARVEVDEGRDGALEVGRDRPEVRPVVRAPATLEVLAHHLEVHRFVLDVANVGPRRAARIAGGRAVDRNYTLSRHWRRSPLDAPAPAALCTGPSLPQTGTITTRPAGILAVPRRRFSRPSGGPPYRSGRTA